mmetsp:Transcript_39095/g.110482  ORF Transcript_39095/g.110482 Transcript_39095/m.110482 type:complete len:526 (+) Transcript_39095:128-1705(+)
MGHALGSAGEAAKDAALTTFCSHRTRRWEKGLDPKETCSKYRGSYVILTEFLADCRERALSNPLTEDEYEYLRHALDDLSQHGGQNKVDLDQDLFAGGADVEAYSDVLCNLGITMEHAQRAVCSCGSVFPDGASSACRKCGLPRPEGSACAPPEQGRHLHDKLSKIRSDSLDAFMLGSIEFDKYQRTCIKTDTQTILYAFSEPFDLLDRYNIERGRLGSWIGAIAGRYHQEQAYHDWRHAFDVMQFVYLSMTRGEGITYLNYQDTLALYVASLAHDVGHPGMNNAFLVKTQHHLALLYNDRAPLENMHAHICFQVMQQPAQPGGEPGCGFLEGLDEKAYTNVRGKVIDAILATDMADHFEIVDRLGARVSQATAPGGRRLSVQCKLSEEEGKQESRPDRRMLLKAFIHMADLGHTCRPWDLHKHLVVALEDEFFVQGDQERRMGMPIMPMMDRDRDSLCAGQAFFLEKIVYPLLEPLTHFLHEGTGDSFKANLMENKRRWEALVNKHGKTTARAMLVLEAAGGTA